MVLRTSGANHMAKQQQLSSPPRSTEKSTHSSSNQSESHQRPTEAQLRWAQFHRKTRARQVKERVDRLWSMPAAVKDVEGAFSDDGVSTASESSVKSSGSPVFKRKNKPRISRGRRALLKVSQRSYEKRHAMVMNQGFQFFGDKENKDEIQVETSSRRRNNNSQYRSRRNNGRTNRFEAVQNMLINLNSPEKPEIVRTTKRWTRPKTATMSGGTNFQDWQWGLARRKRAAGNRNRLSQLPFDRRASWLVHQPSHQSSVKYRRYTFSQPVSSDGQYLEPVSMYEGPDMLSPGLNFDQMVSRLQEHGNFPLPDQDIMNVSARYLDQLPKSEPIQSPRVVRRPRNRAYDPEEPLEDEPLTVARRPRDSIGSRFEQDVLYRGDGEELEMMRVVRRSKDSIGSRFEQNVLYRDDYEENDETMRVVRRSKDSIGSRFEQHVLYGEEEEGEGEPRRLVRRSKDSIGSRFEQTVLYQGDEDETHGSMRVVRRSKDSSGARFEQNVLYQGEEEEEFDSMRVVRRSKDNIGTRFEQNVLHHDDVEDHQMLQVVRRSKDSSGARFEQNVLYQGEEEEEFDSMRVVRRSKDNIGTRFEQNVLHHDDVEDHQMLQVVRRSKDSSGARFEQNVIYQGEEEDEFDSMRVVRRSKDNIGTRFEQNVLHHDDVEDHQMLQVVRRSKDSSGARFEQNVLYQGEEEDEFDSMRVVRRSKDSSGARFEQDVLYQGEEEEFDSMRVVRRSKDSSGARFEQSVLHQGEAKEHEEFEVVRRNRDSSGSRFERNVLHHGEDEEERILAWLEKPRNSVGDQYERGLLERQQQNHGRVSEAHSLGSTGSDFFEKARRMHDSTPTDFSGEDSHRLSQMHSARSGLGSIVESTGTPSPRLRRSPRRSSQRWDPDDGDWSPSCGESIDDLSSAYDDRARIGGAYRIDEEREFSEASSTYEIGNKAEGGAYPRSQHFYDDSSPYSNGHGRTFQSDLVEQESSQYGPSSHTQGMVTPGSHRDSNVPGKAGMRLSVSSGQQFTPQSGAAVTPRTVSRSRGALLDDATPSSEYDFEQNELVDHVDDDHHNSKSSVASFREGAAKMAGGFFQLVTGKSGTKSAVSESGSAIRAVAAFRKTQSERLDDHHDESSSTSSYHVLPDGFRKMVRGTGTQRSASERIQRTEHLTTTPCQGRPDAPSGLASDQSRFPSDPHSPSRSFSSRSSGNSFSPEHGKRISRSLRENSELIGDTDDVDHAIIDTDDTTSDASEVNPAFAASLMMSPTILTKRHQQAIKAIERRNWEQSSYLVNANPWLAEMTDVTTNQYLLHKLALYGASKFLFSDNNDAVDVVPAAPLDLNKEMLRLFPSSVHKFDQDGNLPLHMAAASGNVEMAILLGERFPSGASVRNNDGMLPLHLAVQACVTPLANANGEMVYGADFVALICQLFPAAVAVADGEGDLPLHIAADTLEGEVGVDIVYLLLDEADRQVHSENGLRFVEKVKVSSDDDSVGDHTIETEAPTDSSQIDNDIIHCNMVKNQMGLTALTTAIEAGSGWQVIEAIARGPGGARAAQFQDANRDNALHLLLSRDFGDPQAALSILKISPEAATARNAEGMLPIEIACLNEMPDEVILAIVLVDAPVDLSKKDVARVKEGYGGSWWYLMCESDDHYVDLVEEIVAIFSYEHLRELSFMKGGQQGTGSDILSRATPLCREALLKALLSREATADAANRLYAA